MSDELRAWVRDQVQKYAAIKESYKTYAEKLEEILEHATRRIGPHVLIQARAKSVPSFAEKALRKREKYRDPVHQLTDLCGARVITHTKDESAEVSEFIRKHFEIDEDNSLDTSSRLQADQFGYRADHYIVRFKAGEFLSPDTPIPIPDEVRGLAAEIQVRTIAQHCWADIGHDRIYKGGFDTPIKWKRESARAAALLEDVDETFARVVDGLESYRTSVGAYLSEKQMDQEIETLAHVREFDPRDPRLALQLARLLMVREQPGEAIDVLSNPEFQDSAPHLHALGLARFQKHKNDRTSKGYQQGRANLEKALMLDPDRADVLTDLARSYGGLQDEKAFHYLERAFAIDSTNPETLAEFVELKIAEENSLKFLPLIRPTLEAAIRRSHDHAEVKVNLPWAFSNMGEFYLLLGRSYESLGAYAKAVQLSTAKYMIDDAYQFVRRVWKQRKEQPSLEWVHRLLLLGKSVKFHDSKLDSELQPLAPDPKGLFQAGPVVIVAGGCDESVRERIAGYHQLLSDAFREFRGTILCGGTTAGISGLVGDLTARYSDRICSVGYLPRLKPRWAVEDARYSHILNTDGADFSPVEPLQNWIDLLAAGIKPSQVRLLGINGGEIAAFEYRLALALGATVGILRESGREAGRLLWDTEWRDSPNLIFLPADLMTLKAFVSPPEPLDAGPDAREKMARKCHEMYQTDQLTSLQQNQLALADWEKLPESLKESNRQLADHIAAKLAAVGRKVCPIQGREAVKFDTKGKKGRKGKRPIQGREAVKFDPDEIELMAEMEHGRWNLERLLQGWTLGNKDIEKKVSPYLVPWQDLSEEIREYDRIFVRGIPEILREIGMEVGPRATPR
jgi:ppGpp synthetase/RelA/SpoT-type nucleotidyltranferase